MQNIRPVSEKKWDISNHAFYQAYHFAMRYKEFKELLLRKEEKVLLHLIKEIRQLRREKNMNEDMKIGAKIALEGVKEELIKVRAELKRKGYDNRRGFTTIEAYIDDSIKELK